MTSQYRIIKSTSHLPITDLFLVPHKLGIDLTLRHPVFGPSSYQANLAKMQEHYFHSPELSDITFREPTTSQSISTCAYNFTEYAKPQILDTSWLQLGRIVRASGGVFMNPPKDEQGNPITDEVTLKTFLKAGKKENGIYLLGTDSARDFAFVPYESFKQGVQDSETFARSGLARGLEYTTELEASKLRGISSKQNYQREVNVWGFDQVQEPVLRVACLDSDRSIEGDRLYVDGDCWIDGYDGYAFGVL